MNLPPLDLLLYARSRPDPRERLLILTAMRMAFPVLHQDPDWNRQIEALRKEIGRPVPPRALKERQPAAPTH